MSYTFRFHTLDSAPDASRSALEDARRRYGIVPKVIWVMAESPELIRAHAAVGREFWDRSALTTAERQVVLLTVCYLHGSEDCMAALSRSAEAAGLAPDHVDAIRGGQPLTDERLEALRTFTAAMVRRRGRVGRAELDALSLLGFTARAVLDVIVGIALKTMSNYTNHVIDAAARKDA